MGRASSNGSTQQSSPVVLGLHAAALALFALVIGGGAGSLAQPLVAVGFVLVAVSFAAARTRPSPPPAAPHALPPQATELEPAQRAASDLRVAA